MNLRLRGNDAGGTWQEPGWQLANGAHWMLQDLVCWVELCELRLAPGSLELVMRSETGDRLEFQFGSLGALEVSGDLHLGVSETGWELADAVMLRTASERRDGRSVYVLDLSNGFVYWESALGQLLETRPGS
jgi:hypothetical protein